MSALLIEHGTVLSRLKPVNILQAAEADLKLRERKAERQADPEARYSFMTRHVKRARSAAHLVALAYFEPLGGATGATDKVPTLIIYHDRELLRRTLLELLATDALDVVPCCMGDAS